jgi:hypothetical protein
MFVACQRPWLHEEWPTLTSLGRCDAVASRFSPLNPAAFYLEPLNRFLFETYPFLNLI